MAWVCAARLSRAFTQTYMRDNGLLRRDAFRGTYRDVGLHERMLTLNGTVTDMNQYKAANPSTVKVYHPGSWFHAGYDVARQCIEAAECAPLLRARMLCNWHAMYWPPSAWQLCGGRNDASYFQQLCRLWGGEAAHRNCCGLSTGESTVIGSHSE